MKLTQDLREFVASLTSRRAEFLVVGAHAVAYHGYPRFTGDIDLWVRPTLENATRVLEALVSFGFGGLGLTLDDFVAPGKVVQLGYPPSRIDLLTSISGVTFDEAWDDRVHGLLDGLPVDYLSLAALVRNKRASGRTKDLADLERLIPDSSDRETP